MESIGLPSMTKRQTSMILFLLVSSLSIGQPIKAVVKYDCDLFVNYNYTEKVKELKKGDSVIVKAFNPTTKSYFVLTVDTTGYIYEGNVERTYFLIQFQDDTRIRGKETFDSPCGNDASQRIGAKCKDGTFSSATGRGACSHHGGVAYWICKKP